MVKEAEEFKDQDKMYADKVEARNAFESYVYSLRNALDEKATAEALGEEDKRTLQEATDGALSWLEENGAADKEEFDSRRKELEGVAIPILQKAKGGAPPQPAVGGAESEGDGPTVEEVD